MNMNRESVVAWARAYLTGELCREISEKDLNLSFSEMGLDSLDEMVMVGEMEEYFGIEFDPVTLLQYPVIMEMLDAATELALSKKA